jgi:hypothetical protein
MRVRTMLAAMLMAGGGIALAGTSVKVPFPEGYRGWFHVKSMVIFSDANPLHASFGGFHSVYVNDVGRKALASGGPYANGTVFVFDLLEAKAENGAYVEGARKFIGVMRKDARHFAATGAWGFETFEGDSQSRRLVKDGGRQCYGCHQPQRDLVFSKFRK